MTNKEKKEWVANIHAAQPSLTLLEISKITGTSSAFVGHVTTEYWKNKMNLKNIKTEKNE